ncbi:hypothetical protein HY256_02610, partial [Candidatus Sumerlaeota bacterium]|nr:hypothetical protein [Candidatus Sumerlaeota bacterium]
MHSLRLIVLRYLILAGLILVGTFLVNAAQEEGDPVRNFHRSSSDPIGHGDRRIHIIPTLSSPSVKNGGRLTITAVVKALAGVREVKAEILDGERTLEELELKPGEANSGGFGPFEAEAKLVGPVVPNVGLYAAQWTARGLEEKNYSVHIRVMDMLGHVFEDNSLQFSDPTAGITVPGTSNYLNGSMRRVGAYVGDNDSSLGCAVIDAAGGFAYFGTHTVPGTVVKVALGGAGAPTRVGAVTLKEGEDNLTCGVIDAAAGYAYFGT